MNNQPFNLDQALDAVLQEYEPCPFCQQLRPKVARDSMKLHLCESCMEAINRLLALFVFETRPGSSAPESGVKIENR